MDAKEYLIGMKRMCKFYGDQCNGCELKDEPCDNNYANLDRLIDVVSRWLKDHPSDETRQDEFLKLFPNAPYFCGDNNQAIVNICPQIIDEFFDMSKCREGFSIQCRQCKQKYWLAPIEGIK